MNVHILPIPKELARATFPILGNHILGGLANANHPPEQMAEDVNAGRSMLWGIWANKEPVAAFLTSIRRDDDGTRFVLVYALGGSHLDKWAADLGDEMIRYAQHEKVDAVRFAGRKAWARVLPSYTATPATIKDHSIYERRVAP